jgi:hypothetical protein
MAGLWRASPQEYILYSNSIPPIATWRYIKYRTEILAIAERVGNALTCTILIALHDLNSTS